MPVSNCDGPPVKSGQFGDRRHCIPAAKRNHVVKHHQDHDRTGEFQEIVPIGSYREYDESDKDRHRKPLQWRLHFCSQIRSLRI